MALTIVYYKDADAKTGQCYGIQSSTASVTLSGTSAGCGAIPSGASIARFKAGEACIVSNNGAAASATNGQPLDAGESIDLAVPVEGQFLAKTA